MIEASTPGSEPPAIQSGGLGVWLSREMARDDLTRVSRSAEELGYSSIWISGGIVGGVFDVVEEVLRCTGSVTVGTSVANIWVESPRSVTRAFNSLEVRYPGRFYVGLGVSHAGIVRARGLGTYGNPIEKMESYLDHMDAQPDAIPTCRRLLGALGPRMLQLARHRAGGSLPYLTPPAHTRFARDRLPGPKLLIPELGVVVDEDSDRARSTARGFLRRYLSYPSYMSNLQRFGFLDADISEGSKCLIDELFALGSEETVMQKVRLHLEAGATQVAVQVLSGTGGAVVRTLGRLRGVAT